MRLSVAMTTYCGAPFVQAQLASLFAQVRPADEVVIVDDHSPDNTAELVATFIATHNLSNWTLWVNEQNLGYKANFKKAIGLTTGDLIFLADQDDVWHADKLQVMEQVFDANHTCQALSTSFDYIDGNDLPISVVPIPKMSNQNLIKRPIRKGAIEQIHFSELVSYNISPGCTMAFRAQCKDVYLAHTLCAVVHDWELNFVSAMQDGCYFLNVALIDYRIHSNNAVGIPGVGGEPVQRSAYAYRLCVAKQMRDYTTSFRAYQPLLSESKQRILQQQLSFVAYRYEALKSKKLHKLIALHKFAKNYSASVTTKGRIADLLCIFK